MCVCVCVYVCDSVCVCDSVYVCAHVSASSTDIFTHKAHLVCCIIG